MFIFYLTLSTKSLWCDYHLSPLWPSSQARQYILTDLASMDHNILFSWRSLVPSWRSHWLKNSASHVWDHQLSCSFKFIRTSSTHALVSQIFILFLPLDIWNISSWLQTQPSSLVCTVQSNPIQIRSWAVVTVNFITLNPNFV